MRSAGLYLGRKEDERMGSEMREGFERCFLPQGVMLRPRSELKE